MRFLKLFLLILGVMMSICAYADNLLNMAIVSPSSPSKSLDRKAITDNLETLGFHPVWSEHVMASERFMAGSDKERSDDLMAAFSDPNIDAVMAVRGGYGSPRLLDKLDYKKISKNKKYFWGFSDATALQLALWKKSKIVSFTGLQASFLEDKIPAKMRGYLDDYLAHKSVKISGLKTVVKGKASGTLIGGNLSMICAIMGTPYEPDFKNAILVLEEIKEEPYKIDRMITQLRLAGVFEKVSGVVLAGFEDCIAKDLADGTIEEVLNEQFSGLSVPVVKGFKYGHKINEAIFPIGGKAKLDATQGVLEINEY